MTKVYTAPYGEWKSKISLEDATKGTKTLNSPRASPVPGAERGYYLVSKDDGRSTIYQTKKGDVGPRTGFPEDQEARKHFTNPTSEKKVLPEPHGVGTTVYEYGGQAYAVMARLGSAEEEVEVPGRVPDLGDEIVFADPKDNGVYILDVETQTVRALVPGRPEIRYGDFDAPIGSNSWILAVQEDHTIPAPAAVRNYIVAIHRVTGEVKRAVEGADFYSYPRWASTHAGSYISWRQWNHPDLPFEGVTLHLAFWHQQAANIILEWQVAGFDRQCVGEAVWTPDYSKLVFGMEATGENAFRQLYYVEPGLNDKGFPQAPQPIVLHGLEEVEFGDASWMIGCQTMVFTSPSRVVLVGTRFGRNHLIYADITNGAWVLLDRGTELVELKFDPLAALSESSFLVVGSGFRTPQAVYRVDIDMHACNCKMQVEGGCDVLQTGNADHVKPLATRTLLHSSTTMDLPPRDFSKPKLICVPALNTPRDSNANQGGATHNVYGWFWPPHNHSYKAPEGTLPPLIITPHGGPTGYTAPGLHMMAQYFATRGYAYCAVNYSGSSGHGRDYRDRLWKRWGVLDRDDVASTVRYLSGDPGSGGTQVIQPGRVGIEGGSAGGYNVLQCLVHYPALFAAGVCCCGVANTVALSLDTHKLESHYLDRLLWSLDDPPSPADKAKIHRDRSPLFHADKIEAPLMLIHGDRDTVVPISQSLEIRSQIQGRGGDVELVVLAGEGHLFKKTESNVKYLQSQARWWETKVLAKTDLPIMYATTRSRNLPYPGPGP